MVFHQSNHQIASLVLCGLLQYAVTALSKSWSSPQLHCLYVPKVIRVSPARAQVPQLIVLPSASAARLTARGLAAMAVMNMAEEMVLVWKQVSMT